MVSVAHQQHERLAVLSMSLPPLQRLPDVVPLSIRPSLFQWPRYSSVNTVESSVPAQSASRPQCPEAPSRQRLARHVQETRPNFFRFRKATNRAGAHVFVFLSFRKRSTMPLTPWLSTQYRGSSLILNDRIKLPVSRSLRAKPRPIECLVFDLKPSFDHRPGTRSYLATVAVDSIGSVRLRRRKPHPSCTSANIPSGLFPPLPQ